MFESDFPEKWNAYLDYQKSIKLKASQLTSYSLNEFYKKETAV